MISEKTSMEELNKHMKLISKTYFESKKELKQNPVLSDVLSEEDISSHSLFIKKVKDVYEKLDPLDQLFINNDFFYQDYPFWWYKLYTASTYYRCKKKAVVRFLRLFFNED